MEDELGGVDGRVQGFVAEGEIDPGVGDTGDAEFQDFAIGGREELDFGKLRIRVFRVGRDPCVRAFGLRFEGLELLGEIQLAQKECQGSAHVIRFFQFALFGAALLGRVKQYIFAVRQEKFAGRRGVFPAHAPGLLEIQDARFGVRRGVADAGVSLGKIEL